MMKKENASWMVLSVYFSNENIPLNQLVEVQRWALYLLRPALIIGNNNDNEKMEIIGTGMMKG